LFAPEAGVSPSRAQGMIRISDRSSGHDCGDTGAPINNTRPTRNDRMPVARAFLTSALPAMRALTYPPKTLKRRPQGMKLR